MRSHTFIRLLGRSPRAAENAILSVFTALAAFLLAQP